MLINHPIVATQTIRSFVKKSGVTYLNQTAALVKSLSGATNTGITVWQSGDAVLFDVIGNSDVKNAENLAKFADVLAINGFSFVKNFSNYEIVKAVA